MATVHLGTVLGPFGFSRTVAIKRLHSALSRDPEFVAMFLDEARIASRLVHPNIVRVLGSGRTDKGDYIVMELVKGFPLQKAFEARALGPRALASVDLPVHTAPESRMTRSGSRE